MTAPGLAEQIAAMHEWFGLSYANYLTVPRSLIQEMPAEWQGRLAALMTEMDSAFVWPLQSGARIEVRLRDARGRMLRDRLCEYRHPDREAVRAARAAALPEAP